MSDHDQNPNPPAPSAPDPSEMDQTNQTRRELLAYARDIDEVVTRHVTKETVATRLDRVLRRARQDAQGTGQPGPPGTSTPLPGDGPGDGELLPAGTGHSLPTGDAAGGPPLHELASALVGLLLRSLGQAQHTAQEFEDAALRNAAAITRRAREQAEAVTARAEEKERIAQHVVQEAHRESAQIITEARRKAARILDDARAEADADARARFSQLCQDAADGFVPSTLEAARLRTELQPALPHWEVLLPAGGERDRGDASQRSLTFAFEDIQIETVGLPTTAVPWVSYIASLAAEPVAPPDIPARRRLEKVRDHLKMAFPRLNSGRARGSWSRSATIAPIRGRSDFIFLADFSSLFQERYEAVSAVVCAYQQYPRLPSRVSVSVEARADFIFMYPSDRLVVCDYAQHDDAPGSQVLRLETEALKRARMLAGGSSDPAVQAAPAEQGASSQGCLS